MRRAPLALVLAAALLQAFPVAAPEADALPACRAAGMGTAGVCTLWASSLDGLGPDAPGGDGGWTVRAAPDGHRVFAAGTTVALSGRDVGTTVAYDAGTGSILWTHERAADGGRNASERALALSPDGSRLHVLGHESAPDQRTVLTTLDTGNGSELWNLTLPFARFQVDVATAPDGTVYVTSGPGASVAAIGPDGEVEWSANVVAGPNAQTTELMVAPDGESIFAVGMGFPHAWAAALEPSTGAVRSKVSFPVGFHQPRLQEAVLSPDGRQLFVGGTDAGLGGLDGWDYVLLALDTATGETLWKTRFDEPGPSYEAAWAVDVAPDGSRFYVTGLGTSPAGDDDYVTLALSPTDGAIVWKARFNAGTFTFDDVFGGIVASADGKRVYVGGTSSLHPVQMTVAAYDAATGLEAWRFAYLAERDPVFGHAAWGLDVSPDSSVLYVTGDANQDLFTMALDKDLGLGLPSP